MLVDDLFRVLDVLRIERCILAGESMGGLTVLQAALQSPDRFSGSFWSARYQGLLVARPPWEDRFAGVAVVWPTQAVTRRSRFRAA